jgi:hypothetical protein
MSTSIHVHGPFTFNAEHVEDNRSGFAVIRVTTPGATLTLINLSRDALDGLIRAALTAKDLTPGYVEQPPPDAGDSDPGGAS